MTTDEYKVYIRYRGAQVIVHNELMRDDVFDIGSHVMDCLEERLKTSGEGCDYEYPAASG